MVSVGKLMVMCHGLVLAAAALALWAGGAAGAAARYDTATPYAPVYNKYKYIPLHSERYDPDDPSPPLPPAEQESSYTGMAPSELILTGLRTILDVVRNVNRQRAQKHALTTRTNTTALAVRRTRPRNGTAGTGRGFEDYYDEHHDHHETTTTAKPMKQGRYTDPWAGYYDWIINEGSFKFWSVFQLFTAALLLYACLSAIYYAKFNPILPDYSMEYDDYFLQRTVGRNARSLDKSELPSGISWMSPQTFQFILDAISQHYAEE
ncbi:uncharacterized protein LOC126375524 [Pectinophora gossypiella]|uniref:uncharacterized protein LOC126375524 n=1 Tax=Pectinophora gossypiella TaxID=13191 RepID=UPI00214F4062|nr:uncharacterized protein LOC126375524 [Pectinophora gossypiella]